MTAKIYLSYAYRDALLADDLKKHLLPLMKSGLVELVMDTEIDPGGNWRSTSNKYLSIANIILLLVSPDFLNSDYCYSTEMMRAIQRHEQGEVLIIPIILRPVYWSETP